MQKYSSYGVVAKNYDNAKVQKSRPLKLKSTKNTHTQRTNRAKMTNLKTHTTYEKYEKQQYKIVQKNKTKHKTHKKKK